MNHPAASPKVLVAPLDWGLGHATRCIPIVHQLMAVGCRVVLAGEEKVAALLQQEFPQLPFLSLTGYRVQYAAGKWGLATKIVAQIPKLIAAIKEEQAWLQRVVAEEKIDAVISDNRYGLAHPQIPSVFITHQLLIKAPIAAAENLLQEINYKYINKFSTCWVPDNAGTDNLAGALSHPRKMPDIPVTYIGSLSRFTRSDEQQNKQLVLLLSGPEPQRTMLEEKLLEDLEEYTEPVVLVRGLPQGGSAVFVKGNVTVYPHLPSAHLQEVCTHASFIIARCGYSTVMDLARLGKKSILIPTPGQTEQEYLAKYLMQKQFALCVEQKKFRLKPLLELAGSFRYNVPQPAGEESLKVAVADFVSLVQQGMI